MDQVTIGVIGTILMIVLLALGVHIALALGVVGLVGAIILNGWDATVWQASTLVYTIVASQDLVVLPLFIFMGVLAGVGDISQSIYDALHKWVGHIRGGMGIATVMSCTAFGVCTGSSLVTAAVFARVSAPQMRRAGYNKKIAYGIVASAGSIGMLIPPSILIVIYGIISQQSVGKLLLAGISPGLMLTFVFSLGIYLLTFLKPEWFGQRSTKCSWGLRMRSVIGLWPIILVGVVIVGGIFLGMFSPTEAASFGAATLVFLALYFTPKGARRAFLEKALTETTLVSAMVFFIMFGAGLFARFTMFSGITNAVMNLVMSYKLSGVSFMIITTVIFLIMGCFMDSISMLSVALPLLTPVVAKLGINPIHYAMTTIMAIECGLVTPPVGLNVYGAHGAAEPDVGLMEVFAGSMPFFVMMLVTTLLLLFFPWFSTILPSLMMGS
jgi:C4-dicarboxylate transporter, DctM subunit